MDENSFNVLFICTGNSARSILSEALLNRHGKGRFYAFSAGSQPKGKAHPAAIKLLKEKRYSTTEFRSKSWDEFAGDNAPEMDIVITVCDNAASESCPLWTNSPVVAHWSISDPAAVKSPPSAVETAFQEAYKTIEGCIKALIQTVSDDSAEDSLRQRLNALDPGRSSE